MPVEIERKFLVQGEGYKSDIKRSLRITQGYLNSLPERTVRIRIQGDHGYITVKGVSDASGTTRFEWEKEIPLHEAQELIKLCEPGIIDKIRHLIPIGEHTFEVDEFLGDNSGLILAEIELPSASSDFERPEWLGEEMTGNPLYYNSSLSQKPYCKFKETSQG